MAFINQAGVLNVKSELNIFSTPPIQTTIESGSLQTYRPITSISNNGPLEFVISGSSHDEYLDLARVFIHVKARIRIDNAVGGNAPAAGAVLGPTNNWLHSMFSSVEIYMNQKCITPPSNCYNYRAYLENLLCYGADAKASHLSTGIWDEDTAGHMDSVTADNEGFTRRNALTTAARTVDLYGPLHCDIFNVDKYLINGVELTIKLHRSKDEFHLMGSANTTGKFEITEAVLYARKVKISSATLLAHHKALNVATAKYPINRVDVKTITIPSTTRSRTLDNVYIGTLPKRIVIGMVLTDSFNGSFASNPYNFQHFNYSSLAVYLDSIPIPSKPYVCDFPNGQFIRAYNSLFEGSNINHSDFGNNISRYDYANGYALVAVDLTPDLSASSSHISLPKTGSLRIDIGFDAPVPNTITAIIFAEFPGLISIDKDRNVVTDYSS